MKNVEKLTDKELQQIAAAGVSIPELVAKYGPAILEKLGDLIGLGKKDSSSGGSTSTQPSTVTNGPAFTNNSHNGNFHNNTTATNYIASNNGDMNGNQTVGCGK